MKEADYIRQHRERYTTPTELQLVPGTSCPNCGGIIKTTYGHTIKWHIYHECPFCGARERRYDMETPHKYSDSDNGRQRHKHEDTKKKNSKKQVAFILVRRGNHYLLTKTSYYGDGRKFKYYFPGGLVDKCETQEQAALRELKEEIGITAKIVKRLNNNIFLGEYTDGSVHTSSEVSHAKWFNAEEITILHNNGDIHDWGIKALYQAGILHK